MSNRTHHRRHQARRWPAETTEAVPLDPAPAAVATGPHRRSPGLEHLGRAHDQHVDQGRSIALDCCRAAGLSARLVDGLSIHCLAAVVDGRIPPRDLTMLLRHRGERSRRS